jgi:hypothetical protein
MSNVINPFNGSDDEYNDYLDHLERKMMEEQEPQEMPEDFQMVATPPTFPSADSIRDLFLASARPRLPTSDYIKQRLDEQNDPDFQKTMDAVAKVLDKLGVVQKTLDWAEQHHRNKSAK